jgi:ribonuclease BN (tRNA processing enzyme)
MDGRARVLVDAGAGAFLRFGEAGARFEDLELVALSHFHTDHSVDLPALVKSGYFSDRDRPLALAGPSGRAPFPGLEDWLSRLFGPGGAYAYLSGALDGGDGLARLDRVTVAPDEGPQRVFDSDRLRVDALPVPHGVVPAIAYRVVADDRALVFGADQNGSNPAFRRFTGGVDLLVAHVAIPEAASGAAVRLHARPSLIGEIAGEAGVGQLVLSHFMARSLRRLDDQVAEVRARYDGPVHVAEDLACYLP